MSGFSPEWLALREPADRAARNRQVLTACGRAFANRDSIAVCDIGAGTGASVRALADLLPRRQHWTLVDSDEGNLAAALQQLAAWGTDIKGYDGGLMMRHGEREIHVRTLPRDLAQAPACWPGVTDLVTASALLDLTSDRWIESLVAALHNGRVALLGTLTFDGRIEADPAHPLDPAVAAAFGQHQTRDKGFGPAAGPGASETLERALRTAGYEVETGESPWAVDRDASALLYATLAGIAAAVHETDALAPQEVEQWLRSGVINTRLLTVGHRDIFAWLP